VQRSRRQQGEVVISFFFSLSLLDNLCCGSYCKTTHKNQQTPKRCEAHKRRRNNCSFSARSVVAYVRDDGAPRRRSSSKKGNNCEHTRTHWKKERPWSRSSARPPSPLKRKKGCLDFACFLMAFEQIPVPSAPHCFAASMDSVENSQNASFLALFLLANAR
jgi:hypothetical protein